MSPTQQPRQPQTYDLTDKEYMFRQFPDGHFGIAGDMRWFDNASFPEGKRGEGLVVDPGSGGLKLGREILGLPQRGDLFIFNSERGDPVTIQLDIFGKDPSTCLPYFEAHGHVIPGALPAVPATERPLMLADRLRCDLIQAIKDFGPVVGLRLGMGRLDGSLHRLTSLLETAASSPDSELATLATATLSAVNARESVNGTDWERQNPDGFQERTDSALVALQELYRRLSAS